MAKVKKEWSFPLKDKYGNKINIGDKVWWLHEGGMGTTRMYREGAPGSPGWNAWCSPLAQERLPLP